MNNPIIIDAEFEPIEAMFKNRGRNADQLPGKPVRFIPEERADALLELDKRILKLRKILPAVLLGLTALFAFIAGKAF